MKLINTGLKEILSFSPLKFFIIFLFILNATPINSYADTSFSKNVKPKTIMSIISTIETNQNIPFGKSSKSKSKKILTEQNGEWPPIWEVPQENSPSAPHFIVVTLVSNPRINDLPLEEGDFIGGFYTDDNGDLQCGGARAWNDTTNIGIALHKDDYNTPEKDGFSNSEQIYFKFFSWATLKDYDIDVIDFDEEGVYSGTDIWYSLSISTVLNIQALVDFDAYGLATPSTVCLNDFISFEAHTDFVPGTPPYEFSWLDNVTGFLSNELTFFVEAVDGITKYFLEATDGDNNISEPSQIIFTVRTSPEADAGEGGIICENTSYQLDGFAQGDYGNTSWSTSSDGTFDNPGILDPIYSVGDYASTNPQHTLNLNVQPLEADICLEADDNVTITITKNAELAAGEDQDCCSLPYVPLTASASATSFDSSTVQWTTSGDGFFSDPSSLQTTYTPGFSDLSNGSITVEACVSSQEPCNATACDSIIYTFFPTPTTNGPSSKTKCEDQTVSISGVAANYNSLLWTSDGDGYFENPNVFPGLYHFGENDILNGSTMATITASSEICPNNPATSDTNLIIKKLPILDVGDDLFYHNPPTQIPLSASANIYTTVLWSTSGSGSFSSPTSLATNYNPSAGDIENCSVILTLTAGAVSPCTGTKSDSLNISFNNLNSQELSFRSGWNVISFNVLPENMDMATIVEPLIAQGILEILQDDHANTLWPAYNINTIGQMSTNEGYKVKMTDNATLIIEGSAVPLPTALTLNEGWNTIGYPSREEQDAFYPYCNL